MKNVYFNHADAANAQVNPLVDNVYSANRKVAAYKAAQARRPSSGGKGAVILFKAFLGLAVAGVSVMLGLVVGTQSNLLAGAGCVGFGLVAFVYTAKKFVQELRTSKSHTLHR